MEPRRIGASAIALICMLLGAWLPLFPSAQAAEEGSSFFAGKTITIVVGFGPGTGYDLYARLVARHLPKHLSGAPSVITQNMPGAGGFTASSHLYNTAARDGTVLGVIDQASPLSQTLGVPGFRADVSKFNWIGRMTSNAAVLFSRTSAGVTDIRQAYEKDLIISAPGQNSRIMSSVMKNLLGMKLRIVTGYHSSAESQLALERGEVDSMTLPWTVLRGEKPDWIEKRFVSLLLQMGAESHPDLKAVPLVTSLARDDEERSIMTLVSNDSRVGRSILAPPGLPAERVGELRKAFSATIRDPELLKEAAREKIDIMPMGGEEMQAMIMQSVQVSPATVARVKTLVDQAR